MNADDQDVRVAAAELGVTPQLLVAVLERRSLHLKPTPKRAVQGRRFAPKREVIRYATEALRRHVKVVSDENIRTGLSELIQHLELET